MTFPYTQSTLLNNSVTADTTVKLVQGMQVATTVFKTAAGNLGQIVLSPQHSTASDIDLSQSEQELKIAHMSFQAAFGLVTGNVKCTGTATEQKGGEPVPFSKSIAEWSN